MNQQQSELYQRIQEYIESHGDLRRKLIINYAWDDQFTKKVVQEYGRFTFLAVSENYSVVPSEYVDKVWHEHLLFTKEYWKDFCQKILGKDLHHTPSDGSDQEFLRNSYIMTVASYLAFFNQKPPTDIWLSPNQQFNSCTACFAYRFSA